MNFVIKLCNNHTVTFERDRVGNVVIRVYSSDGLVASTVESGRDFQKMSSILCD